MSELTVSQLVVTRSDTGSHNRLDLIQSLVPPHYVCNGYLQKYLKTTPSLLIEIRLFSIFVEVDEINYITLNVFVLFLYSFKKDTMF